jgi:hypothetical protein
MNVVEPPDGRNEPLRDGCCRKDQRVEADVELIPVKVGDAGRIDGQREALTLGGAENCWLNRDRARKQRCRHRGEREDISKTR